MIDAGESAETARPPGSALAETALLAGEKRPVRHARQRPRRWVFKMLRRRAPNVYGLLVAQHAETLGTAAFSAAPRVCDGSWISLSCGRSPELCKVIDRQAGELQRLCNGPPIPPDALGGPALATRSSRCHPSSLVQARWLHSRLRRPLPKTARVQPTPLPLPVAGLVSGALLGRPAGRAATVRWPICVVADWILAALVSNAHLADQWSLSGGAAAWCNLIVPTPRWLEPPRSTCGLPTHSGLKPTLSVTAPAFVPAGATVQTGQLVMRGSHVVGLDPVVSFSAQLQ